MKTAYKTFPPYSVATDPVTGITYTSQYDIFTVGAGYLDIAAALTNTTCLRRLPEARSPPPPSLSLATANRRSVSPIPV